MKGYIANGGFLEIMRKGVLKMQTCPHNKDRYCGDHCPKFSEPREDYIRTRNGDRIAGWTLPLCTRDQLFFTELTDNRNK